MNTQYLKTAESKMQDALNHLQDELTGVRSGRANAGLVDSVKVNVYGQESPLKTIATISTPDAKTIQIQPWDASNIAAIEKAISENQNLGLNPSSDGRVVRINVPTMSEETRNQMVKLVREKAESANISLRNARHEAINDAKKAEKAKSISQDELSKLEKDITNSLEKYQTQINNIIADKESELLQT